MSLENLLDQIKKEAEQEIACLEKESNLALKEIDQEKEKMINLLKKEKEKQLSQEKEKLIANHLKEKEFQAEMEILKLKNELIEKAANQAKEKAKKLSNKEIFKKELEKIKEITKENCFVFVPIGKKDFLIDLFKEIPNQRIVEKKLDFEQGFIVENEKFIFKVDLSELIDEKIAEEKDFFFRFLFSQ